ADPFPCGELPCRRREDRRQRLRQLAGSRADGPGRGTAYGKQPQVLGTAFTFSNRRNPAAIGRPADRPPDAGPGLDCRARIGTLRDSDIPLRPTAALACSRALAEGRDDKVDQAIVDLDVAEVAQVG